MLLLRPGIVLPMLCNLQLTLPTTCAHLRLVSVNTIEENILRKSDQKRQLDWLAIQSGGFNTDMLQKLSIKDLLAGAGGEQAADDAAIQAAMRNAEDEADVAAAAGAEKVCVCVGGGGWAVCVCGGGGSAQRCGMDHLLQGVL
jgi:hypothetical protein